MDNNEPISRRLRSRKQSTPQLGNTVSGRNKDSEPENSIQKVCKNLILFALYV